MTAHEEADRNLTEDAPKPAEVPAPSVVLRTLAPQYEAPHHAGYLRHLEDAIKEPKNRNIALTGRYGSGKSSVLDQFELAHKADTLRISINTLGPDEDDEDLTNRIQKELVKQLVYRAEPGKLRRSRFARSRPLTRWRAFFEALGITTGGLLLLWLVGLRPGGNWFGDTNQPLLTFALGGVFVALIVAVVWLARLIIGDRIVSQVTTAGTTITLGDKPTTYFDGFLDEIVTFFDAVEPKYVIFEDLDRFDDPQIFDSLRELNTLINASSHWIGKDGPLRFIYAIKDSLFEKIGTALDETDTALGDESPKPPTANSGRRIDLAAAAVERANRTKFFELVIPVVPFISHRNARDLLAGALTKLRLPDNLVTRPLLDLVARHTTDMRLLINICNEFAVFAEQLYWTDNRAPGMTPDDLFALVSYKNFHLADFESIPQRGSALDTLEDRHRELVRSTIQDLQKKRRELVQTEEKRRLQGETAATLGALLVAVKDLVSLRSTYGFAGIEVDGDTRSFDDASSPMLWQRVSEVGTLTLTPARPQHEKPVIIGTAELATLFPGSIDGEVWRNSNPAELAHQVQQYDHDIASLRGADFETLAQYEVPSGKTPFNDTITSTLDSELARDLVRRGFLTRNYSEYSARFYGSFIGVDVAFFYNHSVQPNQMYVDYTFKTKNAVTNLLEQVPADFTSSVSALNLEVTAHLLINDLDLAKAVVAFISAHYSKDAQIFLDAAMNAPTFPREELVEVLAAHPWKQLFDYIASHTGMPDEDTRLRLLDSALLSSETTDAYDLTAEVRSLLASEYSRLSAFREPQADARSVTVLGFAKAAGIVVADLNVLGTPLRKRIVNAEMYELSKTNLQTALEISTTPTIDELREHDAVWHYCKGDLDAYLDAILGDDAGAIVVLSEAVLAAVIAEQHTIWTDEQLAAVIAASSPKAELADFSAVPRESWPLIVAGHRVVQTATNLEEYIAAHGVDESLAQYLVRDGTPIELHGVSEVDDDDRVALAVRLLNASSLLKASERVALAVQLDLPDGVEAVALVPAGDDLLARTLEAGIVPDEAASFAHFATGGWRSVADAFSVSKNADVFITPALVSGYVAELIQSVDVPGSIRNKVTEDVAAFVPEDEVESLRAIGIYAAERWIRISREQVSRIARVTLDASAVLPHLVRDRDLSPDQLIETMAFLGAPYNALTSGPGVEFNLPTGSSAKTLLERLEAAGRVEIFNRGWGSGKGVRNRI
ncbi:hypothetical protein [Cryobacterium sp. HLT2-28]|uniref:YobI family P-loop NTPase n=1 Tax=Cryobacterium sp. HLT2-28 TaxID=1259146 RepID=UPI00106D3A62|nr:hypothetical protein [Cryobacterium sp. HLT2-28]TFB93195.1 hypothetical protein E3O48_11155 [Cryobacterium sp. HLT2-28]